jgi:hypothetical protein
MSDDVEHCFAHGKHVTLVDEEARLSC